MTRLISLLGIFISLVFLVIVSDADPAAFSTRVRYIHAVILGLVSLAATLGFALLDAWRHLRAPALRMTAVNKDPPARETVGMPRATTTSTSPA